MTANAMSRHRLDGLEPDNLLAFLALLGLMRALEADGRESDEGGPPPRAAWDPDHLPLRPVVVLPDPLTREELAEAASRGLDRLAAAHDFGGVKNLAYDRDECRRILRREARDARIDARGRVDLMAALMSDALLKDEKGNVIRPTPMCLQFGQGHQYFLQRLADVPKQPSPPPRGRGRSKAELTAPQCLAETLYHPWHRSDPTFGFRWDPEEDVRYALMAGDPTDSAYKRGTQHGANRLAAVGLAAVTIVPARKGGRPRAVVIGGETARGFSFAWPVWSEAATLTAIRALLAHPGLRTPGALGHLGVDHVFVTRRVSVGKYMSFPRARPLAPQAGLPGEVEGELHE